MLIRIKYDPAKLGELHAWGMPTCGLVGYDPVAKTVVLDIPESDGPPHDAGKAPQTFADTHIGLVTIGADADTHTAWHAALDKRYQEHAGKFHPQLA